ncbi:MAG TPA: bifunctional riboflavin kinase/FAD synthetase [Selenomonadales bacterium]|nr:bifunctional riboflavin kinase/FAD synthetase [Selenomonadales bacterium]
MEICTRLTDVQGRLRQTAVALGTFDGVHLGHQTIISHAAKLARRAGGPSVVFTFSNHPLSVINPKRCPPLIITQEEKVARIAALGIDVLLTVPFTRELLQLPPRDFVALLADVLQPAYVVVGPNFTFGYKGAGTPELLRQGGKENGFEVVIPAALHVGKVLVSSTAIRQLIQRGKVQQAATLLGRPFKVTGRVAAGDGRGGRILGFPTANIAVSDQLVSPGDGVYAVQIAVGDGHNPYKGLANVGSNPTFSGKTRRIEVHILDFAGDLYGQTIAVDFLAKIRDEKTFDGVNSLKAQIARDISAAQQYYG